MARAIWSGAISFGLVTVPVKLYSATSSHRISFNQFEEGTGARIRYQRVSEDSGEEVPYDRIVKGHEVSKGRYVIVTPEELEAIEPGRSRTIDIEQFVDLDAIDPIVWDSTYFLGPDGETAAKPYALLREAMERTGRVAIGRFVMRTKQYLATIRPLGDVLAIETMHFADEIRSPGEVDALPGGTELSDRELATAEQLIDALTGDWDHAAYRDTYRDRVQELIDKKLAGEEVVLEREEPMAQVTDLMEALRASVAASKRRAHGAGDAGGGADGAEGSQAGETAAAAGDLRALTKEELYERAAQADIRGRSKMSKDELVEALAGRRAG